MGASERNKGARGEREFFSQLDLGIHRNLTQSRSGGSDGEGRILAEAACAVEVKRQERRNLGVWIDQSRKACPNGETPAVAWRPSRRPWRIYLELTMAEFRDYLLWKADNLSRS